MTVQSYGIVIQGDVRGSKVSNTGSHMVKPLLSCPCWILEAVLHGLASALWKLSDLAPSQFFFHT